MENIPERYHHLVQSLGTSLFEKVQNAKVLMVGAGGIGCELLKNLVLSGFKDVEIIDIDTIDLSNLNRQFLFQKKHIGLPKAQVAKESALRFNPDVNIIAHHANIKDSAYGPEFFKKFTVVMNALDNIDARRHVNRLCIATDIPLIESATEGYLGQVQVIKRGQMECYECQPKPAPKTYAYCTIRSSPSKPIHCIIWAKEEFLTHFGDSEAVVNKDDEEVEDAAIREQEALLEKKKTENFAEYLFQKLFFFEIFKKVRVGEVTGKDLWPDKQPPVPMQLSQLLATADQTTGSQSTAGILPDQVVMTVRQNAELFLKCVENLKKRREKGALEFDKDDDDALDFVTASSNLRSSIFGIPLQSRFTVKSQAGNIIPAIATTNAVIAGLIVMESFKVLQDQLDKCRTVVLQKKPSAGRLLLNCHPEKQNPNCFVCASHFVTVKINVDSTLLSQFVEKVLKNKLGMNEPTIFVDSDIIYECGEGLEDDEIEQMNKQLKKTLKDVRMVHNKVIEIDDNSQKFQLKISILHQDKFEEEEQFFEIVGRTPEAKPEAPSKPTETTTSTVTTASKTAPPTEADDDVMIVDEPQINKKRKLGDDDRDDDDVKKTKTTSSIAKNGSAAHNNNNNNNSNHSSVIELD